MISSSSAYDLIVNVCDVHNVNDIIVKVGAEDSAEDIKCDVRAGVSHVRGIVDCWATAIPQNTTTMKGNEILLSERRRVSMGKGTSQQHITIISKVTFCLVRLL